MECSFHQARFGSRLFSTFQRRWRSIPEYLFFSARYHFPYRSRILGYSAPNRQNRSWCSTPITLAVGVASQRQELAAFSVQPGIPTRLTVMPCPVTHSVRPPTCRSRSGFVAADDAARPRPSWRAQPPVTGSPITMSRWPWEAAADSRTRTSECADPSEMP
jgi:hypothetical protein